MAKWRFVLFYISLFALGKENWLLNTQIYFPLWFLSSSPAFLFILCLLYLFLYYSDIWRFLYWVCRHLLQWKICLMLFVKKFLKSNHVMLPTGEVAHLSIHISLLIKDGRKTFQDDIAILVNFLSWRFQLFQ